MVTEGTAVQLHKDSEAETGHLVLITVFICISLATPVCVCVMHCIGVLVYSVPNRQR